MRVAIDANLVSSSVTLRLAKASCEAIGVAAVHLASSSAAVRRSTQETAKSSPKSTGEEP